MAGDAASARSSAAVDSIQRTESADAEETDEGGTAIQCEICPMKRGEEEFVI
jgi:hypothetical protein